MQHGARTRYNMPCLRAMCWPIPLHTLGLLRARLAYTLCWLAGWLAGWLVGWLVGWLAGWLVGWLAGWLAGVQHSCITIYLRI
jgi:hypothetical protein